MNLMLNENVRMNYLMVCLIFMNKEDSSFGLMCRFMGQLIKKLNEEAIIFFIHFIRNIFQ
jgi:hypothetical protein